MKYRIEKDTMGEVKVPVDKLWGAQTQRSLQNFPIGPPASMPLEVITGFGYLKKAAALSNVELGALSQKKCDLICKVCDEIIAGKLNEHFPLVIWQTGSGTQTNMNVNEVIAHRAQLISCKSIESDEGVLHPNDDVNASQSSNDTFPTAMHIAAQIVLQRTTIPSIKALKKSLHDKAVVFKDIIKIGRTHWMDATPLTLGQEFSGYVAMLESGLEQLNANMSDIQKLALGGTAVGTGINCPQGYDVIVAQHISDFTGLVFKTAENKFEALATHDGLVGAHGALKRLAVSLTKIANDIRLMASGPRSGIGELLLPANEPGSSIMPGKVNPTQVEALTMVCAQVMGNDVAITMGGASGQFELNVCKPLIISNFLQSAQLLGDVCTAFNCKCVQGIEPNLKRIDENLNNSLMLVTILTPHLGYEQAADIAKAAHVKGTTLKEELLQQLNVTEEQVNEWLRPETMI